MIRDWRCRLIDGIVIWYDVGRPPFWFDYFAQLYSCCVLLVMPIDCDEVRRGPVLNGADIICDISYLHCELIEGAFEGFKRSSLCPR